MSATTATTTQNFGYYPKRAMTLVPGATYSQWDYFNYKPTKGGAIAVAAVFGVFCVVLLYQVIHYCRQAKRVSSLRLNHLAYKYIPLLVGAIFEIIGYAGRANAANNVLSMGPYIIQAIFILVAPALSAATIYMIFHAMLWQLKCERISFIPPRYATTTFVCGDVLSFILQGAGGGLSSSTSTRETGNHVILGGLAVQLVFFGFFIITEMKFLLTVSKRSPMVSRISNQWKVLNWTLLVVSLLILARSVVRFVEFAEGTDGTIISHEWYLYVFDALFMLACYLLFIVMFKYGDIFQIFVECAKADSEPILYGDSESYNNQKEMGFA